MTPQVLAIEEFRAYLRSACVSGCVAGAPAQPRLSMTAFPIRRPNYMPSMERNGVYFARGLPGWARLVEDGLIGFWFAIDTVYGTSVGPAKPLLAISAFDAPSGARPLRSLCQPSVACADTGRNVDTFVLLSGARKVGSVTAVVRADLQDLSGEPAA